MNQASFVLVASLLTLAGCIDDGPALRAQAQDNEIRQACLGGNQGACDVLAAAASRPQPTLADYGIGMRPMDPFPTMTGAPAPMPLSGQKVCPNGMIVPATYICY